MELNSYEGVLAQQQFLLNFSYQMGALAEVEQVFGTAASLLGEYLKADRCYFAELDIQDPLLIIHRNYSNSLKSLEQVYPLSIVNNELLEELEQGRPVVVGGEEAKELLVGQNLAPSAVTLAVPLLKEHKLVMLGVVQTLQPTNQPEQQISLMQAVLEQT